jgi:hypothetical protein
METECLKHSLGIAGHITSRHWFVLVGVIFARTTMFGAEAVSNFLVMVKNTFYVPGAQKPEHIFYNTNCDTQQQAEKDPWFKGAWHFRNKHAVTHTYCQLNCNPAPVLYTPPQVLISAEQR